MRYATVATADSTTAALLVGEEWCALPAADLSQLLDQMSFEQACSQAGAVLAGAAPTLPLPSPRKVLCCGLNYAEHIRETGREPPAFPTLFAKFADTLTGPHQEVVLPAGLNIDWEAELAVVVGATLRGADRAAALAGIAGYTVANDISVRTFQYRTSQWMQGKAWDRSTPLGPVIVTPDELDPAGADVICRVNGEEVQHAPTGTLVFDSATLLSYISGFTVLRPGDIVLTGSPGGVGHAREPEWYLADGDVVESEITGIGTLRNVVRFTA